MQWSRKYEYIPYEAEDESYFGCRKVVQAEWDYLKKRRASQQLQEPDEMVVEERLVSVVVISFTGINFVCVSDRADAQGNEHGLSLAIYL